MFSVFQVNDGLGESLSKVMSTYQIKCLPKKHPDTSTSSVRQWSSGTVKVDPLAYVQVGELGDKLVRELETSYLESQETSWLES